MLRLHSHPLSTFSRRVRIALFQPLRHRLRQLRRTDARRGDDFADRETPPLEIDRQCGGPTRESKKGMEPTRSAGRC